jgi:hypothetical protein
MKELIESEQYRLLPTTYRCLLRLWRRYCKLVEISRLNCIIAKFRILATNMQIYFDVKGIAIVDLNHI